MTSDVRDLQPVMKTRPAMILFVMTTEIGRERSVIMMRSVVIMMRSMAKRAVMMRIVTKQDMMTMRSVVMRAVMTMRLATMRHCE